MGLLDIAKADIQTITSNTAEFGISVKLTAPSGETVTVDAYHAKHHTTVSEEGNIINGQMAHIAVSEALLVSPYPVRNSENEVDMVEHLVNVADSTGVVKKYIIEQVFPDEAIGLIVLILGDFE